MINTFVCPKPTVLEEIPLTDCPIGEILGQVQRMAFQLEQAASTFSNDAAIQAQATWTPLRSASDATKVTLTPIFSGLELPSSEAITSGGDDNTTVDGVAKYLGEGNVLVTGNFVNISTAVYNKLCEYTQLSINEPNPACLTAYLFLESKKIASSKDTAGAHFGFEIFNFRVGSTTAGKNADNVRPFSFVLKAGWDKTLSVLTADFNPVKLG